MAQIDKLFESINSEILTEEIKLQLAVLYENSLNEAIKAKEADLQEKNTVEIKEFKSKLTDQIDEYLTYFAEEFIKTNSNVIEDSVKVKTAEKVLKTFSGIVNEFNVQLDEKKISDDTKLKESKEEVNKLTKQLIEARKETKLSEKAAMVMEASYKLTTDLQRTKLVDYAKTLTVDELFEKKLETFVKTVLTEKKVETPKAEKLVITEGNDNKPTVTETPVDKYLERL
jgi:hypothetical protein